MKKLLSVILALTMLFGMVMPMSAAAADLTEAERQELLNSKQYEFISLEANADVDAYASFETIADYARFNKSITGSTSNHFATTTYNDATVFAMLPATTYSGATITGTEGYYYKGFYTKALVESKNLVASYVMLADDLLEEDGATVTGYRYDASSTQTPSVIYDGTKTREASTRTVKSSHVVNKTVENGKNYAFIKNNGIQHKIGPVDGSAYSPNSVYLSSGEKTITVGKTGEALSILVGTHNFAGYYYDKADTAVGVAPKASMNKVTVTYADGETDTKYFIMTNTISYTDYNDPNAGFAIVYAPKKDSWTAEDLYGDAKVTAKFLNNDNSAEHGIADVGTLTPEDIIFENPDILMTDSANVASWINNRQDACTGNVGNRVTMANIPLEDKEVESFKMIKFFNYITEAIPTSIPVGTSTTQVRQAFIPVTVNGASDEYDYFAYVGATTDYCALLGATVVKESLQAEIDVLNTEIAGINVETIEEAECDALRQKIADLITKGDGVILESDFVTTNLDLAEERFIEAKAEELVNAEEKVNFPLSEANGANSKLFMLDGAPGDVVDDDIEKVYCI